MLNSSVERVNKAWDCIEAWYNTNAPKWELPKGATDAEIDAVAAHIKVTLPEEFRVSLKRHNGTADGQWAYVCLCSTEKIKSEWDTWAETIGDSEYDANVEGIETNDAFQAKWFCESWVPIDSDGTGNNYAMDFAPGPKGQTGQILYLDNEESPYGPKYSGYTGYLEKIANKLEKGKYALNDDFLEEIGGSDDEDVEGEEENEDGEAGKDSDDGEEDGEDEYEEPKNKKIVKK